MNDSNGRGSPYIAEHFRSGTSAGGWLLSRAAKVKKVGLWLCDHFIKCLK